MTADKISVEAVSAHFGSGEKSVQALSGVDMAIHEGEFVCLVGPSGCGKSTLLRIIAGLLDPNAGRVTIRSAGGDGQLLSVVFQDCIYPWKTVAANVVLFGIGETPKIILTALGAFFIACISTLSAVVSVPEAMREPLRSWGASGMQTFRHLTLPAVTPAIFVALRLGAGMTVLVLVGTEMIQGADGLGYLIWSSWQIYDTERMYVGIVVTALYGAAFQMVIQFVGRLLTPWENNVHGT